MIRVLFVCMGNICRSPMAEAVFRNMVKKAGLSNKIETDSAGTISYHTGEKPCHGTRVILQQRGIPHHGRARQFQPSDVDHFDYILAMDRSNLSDIWQMIPDAEYPIRNAITRDDRKVAVRLFLNYAQEAGLVETIEVPDPYYSSNFEPVYHLVETGCIALLDHLRKAHNL